ncbi:flagellin N-terminal helical domain-containing protein [Vreelandella hamiltonii]|uniref:Flagellin n=1 Tax=Halomonas johnsoniae TaxID=502832 RepID=A0ABQ2WQ06_9GAMM|nr:flagellin [Halomonas johnsoniae]GGW62516.1 flagellin [Halomonas johnsoniae]
MSVINTNITSMIGQSNLSKSQNALQTSMERLSSGLRINSAKDDAAGQAIANRMSAQITGLAQAQRNANDGISLAQTAEGSLNQVNDNLQRIRELAVQAQNGTNSENDLQSIQDEIGQRLNEIDRISKETNFNGVDVLASDRGLQIQVGANDGEQITVNLKEINSSTLGLSNFDVRAKTLDTSKLSEAPVTETVAGTPAAISTTALTFSDSNTGGNFSLVYDDADADTLLVKDSTSGNYYTGTYDSATNTVSFDTSENAGAGVTLAGAEVTATHVNDGDQIVDVDDVGGFSDSNAAAGMEVYGGVDSSDQSQNYYVSMDGGTTLFSASIDFDTGVVTWNSSEEETPGTPGIDSTSIDVTAAALTEVVNFEDAVPAVEIDTSGLSTALVGDSPEVYTHENGGYVIKGEVDGQTVYFEAEVDEATGVVSIKQDDNGENVKLSADPLKSLDSALNQIDSLRSELGAVQNRFGDAITNLSTNETNLSAARSRIEDADYAVEVGNMTRAQILQQAGTSVLAQANQIPQNVLSLLG